MGWLSQRPVDTTAMNASAASNAAIATRQQELAERQYTDAQERQERFDPQYEALLTQAMESQRTQDSRSQTMFDDWMSGGRVSERMFNERAQSYDTQGRRDEAGAAAVAGVENQFASQRAAQQRSLGRAGVSMSSGRALTLDNASRFAQAKNSAAADRGARDQVEATGLSLLGQSASLGRGLQAGSAQSAQLAQGATGQAGQIIGANQQTYNASLTPALGLYQGATGANSSAGNIYGNAAGLRAQGSGSSLAALAGLGQGIGAIWGAYNTSSKKAKRPLKGKARSLADANGVEDARIVSETPMADKVSGIKTPGWRYKRGLGDEDAHIGPYAEDVQRTLGDRAAPGGEVLDMREMARVNHQAIRELAQQVQALEAEIEAMA